LAFFIGITRSFLNPQAKVEAQEAVIGIAFFNPASINIALIKVLHHG
jgi:hypothetical protein